MKPPVRKKKKRSLKDAIHTALEPPQGREIHPSLRGGRNNPVQLGAIGSQDRGRLPQSVAERVFNNVDATDGAYYGDAPLRAMTDQARDIWNGTNFAERQNEPNPANAESVDGLAKYLGLPMPNRSIEPSPYSPPNATHRGIYSRAPRVWDALLREDELERSGTMDWDANARFPRPEGKGKAPAVRMMLDATRRGPVVVNGDGVHHQNNNAAALVANFTMGQGQDEEGPYISMYDRYDLGRIPGADRVIGRPFEIYDRLYYDPDTKKPITVPGQRAIARMMRNNK